MSQKGGMVSRWSANTLLNWLSSYCAVKSMGVSDISSETERLGLVKPNDLVVERVLFPQWMFLTLFIAFPFVSLSFFLPYFSSLLSLTSSVLQTLLTSLAISSLSIFFCGHRIKALWEKHQSQAMKGINRPSFHSLICSLSSRLPPAGQLQEFQPLEQLQTAPATHVSLSFPPELHCLWPRMGKIELCISSSSGRSWLM